MGYFLSATAVKSKTAAVVSAAVIEYFSDYGVGYKPLENENSPSSSGVAIFEQNEDWVVVIWPSYFNSHEFAAAKYISNELNTLVSTSSIYDGESWSHALFKSGSELNRYSSSFRFPIDLSNGFKFISWSVDLNIISTEFNVNKQSIACFFKSNPPVKSGDRCGVSPNHVGSPWMFVDLWEAIGIKYPDLENTNPIYSYTVDYDFDRKLPVQ